MFKSVSTVFRWRLKVAVQVIVQRDSGREFEMVSRDTERSLPGSGYNEAGSVGRT